MTAGMTFSKIEESADRAFAYALLARLAKSYILGVYRTREVAAALDQLIAVLTQQTVDCLVAETSEDSTRLKKRLQDLHHVLAELSRSEEAVAIGRLPVLSGYVEKIQAKTEDLGDIVDALAFAENSDFKKLVSSFSSSLGIQGPEDEIGRMHG